MLRAPAVVLVLFACAGTTSARPPELAGKWSGYWISDTNGHTGPLHAKIRPLGDEAYRVAFRGRFWVVFPFRYATTMHVAGGDDRVVHLTASRRLGPLGTFTTTATATDSSFDAVFSSRQDSGRFVLSRRR